MAPLHRRNGPAPRVRLGPPQRRPQATSQLSGQPLGVAADPWGESPQPAPVSAELLALSAERRELLCSVIGLTVKLGLVVVGAVSLCRLAGAYQQRMERQGEISAVLELQTAKLAKARARFDQLFTEEGEQRLIREQSQWIAPNRMRIVWGQSSEAPNQGQPAGEFKPAPAVQPVH